jgi:glycosyltransferase involved in cell wall biosynthesis
MPASPNRVAVVIATRNRGPELLGTLTRLRALDEQPPIMVVDNGSSDGTAELVRTHHPDVQMVGLRRNRGGAARTVGARLVDSPYVAFSDDDSWWAPGALSRAVELLGAIPGWRWWRPGCWSDRTGGSTRCARRWPTARCHRLQICPARRCSGSSPAARSSDEPPSWRWAGSTSGSGWVARRNCSRSTWPLAAGDWPMWRR